MSLFLHQRPSGVYVVGLIFATYPGTIKSRHLASFEELRVLGILKNRPEWQAGRWNGIGGKIEPGEWPIDAMCRETKQETGLDIPASAFSLICRLHSMTPSDPYSVVYFYKAWHDGEALEEVSNSGGPTDELCRLVSIGVITADNAHVHYNLRWILQMARNLQVGAERARWFDVYEDYEADPPITGNSFGDFYAVTMPIQPASELCRRMQAQDRYAEVIKRGPQTWLVYGSLSERETSVSILQEVGLTGRLDPNVTFLRDKTLAGITMQINGIESPTAWKDPSKQRAEPLSEEQRATIRRDLGPSEDERYEPFADEEGMALG